MCTGPASFEGSLTLVLNLWPREDARKSICSQTQSLDPAIVRCPSNGIFPVPCWFHKALCYYGSSLTKLFPSRVSLNLPWSSYHVQMVDESVAWSIHMALNHLDCSVCSCLLFTL